MAEKTTPCTSSVGYDQILRCIEKTSPCHPANLFPSKPNRQIKPDPTGVFPQALGDRSVNSLGPGDGIVRDVKDAEPFVWIRLRELNALCGH